MRKTSRFVVITLLLALPAAASAMGKGPKGKPGPIDPCPLDVVAATALECPCDGQLDDTTVVPWKNHGQYVRCVVHFRNALRKSGCFTDDSVRRTMARCAARSTCGKANKVRCCTYVVGTCNDPNAGNGIPEGTCSNDGAPCNESFECTRSSARIARDADVCTADGGVVVGGGSVCEPCPVPVP